MERHIRRHCAGAALAVAAVLALGGYADAQTASDSSALALPVSGHIIVTDMGPAKTHVDTTLIANSGTTTQREDVDITMPVLGLLLEGQASLTMQARMTIVLTSASTVARGTAPHVVLHGPAGDANVSVTIAQPVQRGGGYDPADAAVQIRGTGGTGMFAGVRIQADLKGAFRPAGTLYLGYPSPDAALAAVQRGLAQNSALSDTERVSLLQQARQGLTNASMDLFPPPQARSTPGRGTASPPGQAVVSSTLRRTAAQTQVLLRIVVPQGPARQQLRLVVVQQNGTQLATDLGAHAPGETVSASAAGQAPFVVLVYVNDVMVKQISVTAP